MSVEAADRYVAAGAALLDKRGPEGWRETLYAERGRLDIAHSGNCPLGILYGSHWQGMAALGAPGDDDNDDNDEYWTFAAEHGFEHSECLYYLPNFSDEEDRADYSELRDAWLDEIEPAVETAEPSTAE